MLHAITTALPSVFRYNCGELREPLLAPLQAEQQGLGQPLPGGAPAWDVRRVRAFIGVSGVYNVNDLVDHFDRLALGGWAVFEAG